MTNFNMNTHLLKKEVFELTNCVYRENNTLNESNNGSTFKEKWVKNISNTET